MKAKDQSGLEKGSSHFVTQDLSFDAKIRTGNTTSNDNDQCQSPKHMQHESVPTSLGNVEAFSAFSNLYIHIQQKTVTVTAQLLHQTRNPSTVPNSQRRTPQKYHNFLSGF